MVQAPEIQLASLADRLCPSIEAALCKYSNLPAGCPDSLREAIRYSLLAPGKRLRPMLALLAAEACGGNPVEAMPIACAVEMIHAYSLIHDDLPAMDDDDLRRGRPTCHKVYGEAMAILAGDGLLALAFQVVAQHVRPLSLAGSCFAALAEAAGPCQLVGGQADDVLAEQNGAIATFAERKATIEPQEHLESIHARKTGAMIGVSLRLGAMTARAGDDELRALEDYGRRLGLAFQVTDDLLDVRGSDADLGKRVGKDAEKGKVTYPGLLGIDASAAYAAQLVDEACAALESFGPAAEGLLTLARYVLERNR